MSRDEEEEAIEASYSRREHQATGIRHSSRLGIGITSFGLL